MEICIQHMIDGADDMPMLSGSQAELGRDAGKITWNNSLAYAAKHPLLTDETMRENARHYLKGFGAWSEGEIAAWSDDKLDAMITQDIAAAVREMERFDSDEKYMEAAQEGQVTGSIYKGDDGKWYAYIGD
jgi:hypothetical protein